MGSKNSSPIGGYYPTTTNTSQSSSGSSSGSAAQTPDPYAAYLYALALQNAQQVATTPFEPYEGQMIAGFTPAQIAAQQGFENSVGMSAPYYTAAQNLYNQGLQYQTNPQMKTAEDYYGSAASTAYNPMTPLSQSYYTQAINASKPEHYNVSPYLNPYQEQVVDATMRQLEQVQKNALGQNTQQSVLRGSYGGSGQFLGRAEVARQQALSNAQTLAQLNASNYTNAQDQYNKQRQYEIQSYLTAGQQLGNLGYQNAALKTQALQAAAQGLGSLGADQQRAAAANIANLASGMSNLGTQAQQGYLQSLAALSQSGAQQQQLQQQQLSNAYQQWLQAKAYPYQQTSFLSGLAQGLGPLLGSYQTQQGQTSSTGTGSQIGMQPYANQSGGGGLGGLLSLGAGLGMKALFPGMKDGGRVESRKEYAAGGAASEDEDQSSYDSYVSGSSPYVSVSQGREGDASTPGFGSLLGQNPYSTGRGNYITNSLKLSKIIPSAKELVASNLSSKIAEAITGIPRTGEVAPVSREITSNFFGSQGNAASPFSDLARTLSSTKKSSDSDSEEGADEKGFGSLSSLLDFSSKGDEDKSSEGSKDGSLSSIFGEGLSSLLGSDKTGFFADGGRITRAEGGANAAPAMPRTIGDLMGTNESQVINQKMNPTGKSNLGFAELLAQARANSPGPQLSPEEQGMPAMPAADYYSSSSRNYPRSGQLSNGASFQNITGSMGMSPKVVATDTTEIPDQYKNFIGSLYTNYLGRPPAEWETRSWFDSLVKGKDPLQMEIDVQNSPESTNTGFIRGLYSDIMGRPAESGDIATWKDKLAQGVPGSVVQDLLSSSSGALPPRMRGSNPVQGYYSKIANTQVNPYTGLFNLAYTSPYRGSRASSALSRQTIESTPAVVTAGTASPEATPAIRNPVTTLRNGGRAQKSKGGSLSGRELFDYFTDKGANTKEATVLTAMAKAESNFNPYVSHDRGTGFGLWGHGKDRWSDMQRYTGQARPGWQQQADFALWELRNSPKTALARSTLSRAQTPEQITAAGMHFERPQGYKANAPWLGHNWSGRFANVENLLAGRDLGAGGNFSAGPQLKIAGGGEPNRSSIMYNAPSSAGLALGKPPEKPADKGSLQLSDLLERALSPETAPQGELAQPKLAAAPEPMEIEPITPPVIRMMDSPATSARDKYLDSVIAMNRANGGRLHFADGGTDDESRDRFYREQLEGSAPQYDPEAGWDTAGRMGEIGLNLAALFPAGKAIKPLQTAYKTGKGIINAIRNMRGLTGAEQPAAEPGFGALEYQPRAPRGRQPSPGGEPIPAGLSVPKEGMSKFESNTEAMRRPGVPGREIYYWSSLRNPQGNRPMNRFEENQANLNWNRFGQYEPNKAPAYYDKYGNVAPPKVSYNGQAQRPISDFEANQGYFTQGIPGRDTRINSVARGPVARGFGTRDMGFTPAELGQELVPMGPRGMSVPPSRIPATRSNLPTLATGSRGGGGEPPIYADYRDVTGNILNGPRGGNLVPSTGGGGNLVPPGGGGRPPRNFITKTAETMMSPPGAPPSQPVAAQMDNPHQLPPMDIYGPKAEKTAPAPRKARPKRAAPKAVDNRRYWGDWRDVEPFESDPIGGFLDRITGDVRAARKPGNINSPMSPYAGDRFAYGGRAYREEGGFLDGLGDALGKGFSNLRSSKTSPISEGLITAGLGMMASPQHNPLRAIGEGGLLGVQAYNTASQREREEQKLLGQQKIDADFAQDILDKLRKMQQETPSTAFPNASTSPIVRRRGGSVRRGYAQGGQPQQDEGFDPFEAIGAVGDTIGSGLESLGETIGGALMPRAEAAEAPARAPRRSSRSPIADGLITAGLGMMASPAHDPLRAIGEGGLRGVQAYETSADAQRKEDKLEEERKQNEDFAKSLSPKPTSSPAVEPAPTITKTAATTTPAPVVAMDRTAVETDPMAESLRRLEILQSAMPQNAAQDKFIRRQMDLEKIKIAQIKYQQNAANKAGAASPGSKGDIKAQEELGKASADQALNVGKAAQSAQTTMSDFANMHRALREDKISPGPVAPIARKFHQFMGEAGVQSYADQAALEDEMTRLGVKQVMADLGGRLGAGISNADRDAIMEMSLNLSKSKGYNMALLEAAIKTQQRALEAQKWTDDYIKEHGSIDANYMTAYSKWASDQPALVSPSLRKILAKEKEERLGTESSKTDDDNLPVGHVYVDPSSKKKWRKSKEGSRWDQTNWEEVQ